MSREISVFMCFKLFIASQNIALEAMRMEEKGVTYILLYYSIPSALTDVYFFPLGWKYVHPYCDENLWVCC